MGTLRDTALALLVLAATSTAAYAYRLGEGSTLPQPIRRQLLQAPGGKMPQPSGGSNGCAAVGPGKLATLDDAGAVVFALPCTLTKAIGSFERCQVFESSGSRQASTCDDSFCFREVALPGGGAGWVPDFNMTAGQGSTNLTAAPAPQCAADLPAPSAPTESIPSNNVTDAACVDLEPGQRVVVGAAITFVYPALCTDDEPVGVVEECEVFQLLGAAEESVCGEEGSCFYQVGTADNVFGWIVGSGPGQNGSVALPDHSVCTGLPSGGVEAPAVDTPTPNVPPAQGCAVDADCQNPDASCRVSSGNCENGQCQYGFAVMGTVCPEGFCNDAGECAYKGCDPSCSDFNECQMGPGLCELETSTCTRSFKPVGDVCSTGLCDGQGNCVPESQIVKPTDPCRGIDCSLLAGPCEDKTSGTCNRGACSFKQLPAGELCYSGELGADGSDYAGKCDSEGTCIALDGLSGN